MDAGLAAAKKLVQAQLGGKTGSGKWLTVFFIFITLPETRYRTGYPVGTLFLIFLLFKPCKGPFFVTSPRFYVSLFEVLNENFRHLDCPFCGTLIVNFTDMPKISHWSK